MTSSVVQSLFHRQQSIGDRGAGAVLYPGEDSPSDPVQPLKNVPQIPREGFSRLNQFWFPRSRRSVRLMPDVWRDVINSDRENIYCALRADDPIIEGNRRRSDKWGFDESCRLRIHTAMNDLTAPASSSFIPLPISSIGASPSTVSTSSLKTASRDIIVPQAELFDISLDIYAAQFHPLLPIMHLLWRE